MKDTGVENSKHNSFDENSSDEKEEQIDQTDNTFNLIIERSKKTSLQTNCSTLNVLKVNI